MLEILTKKQSNPPMSGRPKHYYGDAVRGLFLTCAIIMLIGLPVLADLIRLPIVISIASMLILGFAAGFTNPTQKWDAVINVMVASVGFVVFELYAVDAYNRELGAKFFITNLLLGFLFLLATYFSVKTLRGIILNRNQNGGTPATDR